MFLFVVFKFGVGYAFKHQAIGILALGVPVPDWSSGALRGFNRAYSFHFVYPNLYCYLICTLWRKC